MLVFTGGIGENSVSVREQVCSQLSFLDVHIDPTKNKKGAEIISKEDSKITIRIVAADEDGQIARHTRRLLR
jgi:acetate kinase